MVFSFLSLLISLGSIFLSYITFKSDVPDPIVQAFEPNVIGKHGLFTYNEHRDFKRQFFFWQSGVLVFLQVVNTGAKPITLFNVRMNSAFDNSQFLPLLTKETALEVGTDHLFAILDNEAPALNGIVSVGELMEDNSIVVPANSSITKYLFFQFGNNDKTPNPDGNFLLSWDYATKEHFWSNKRVKLKQENIPFHISDLHEKKHKELHPELKLNPEMLKQISSN